MGAPAWLATYYWSLVLLDPIAALLFALRSRAGVVLAAVVLISNGLANGYANFVLSSAEGVTVGQVAVLVIGALSAALLIAMPQLWPRR